MIEFTQYLLPDGRKRLVYIDLPDDVEIKARDIIADGYRFECEILSTGLVSLTIFDPEDEVDVAIEIVKDGPGVKEAIIAMVQKWHRDGNDDRRPI